MAKTCKSPPLTRSHTFRGIDPVEEEIAALNAIAAQAREELATLNAFAELKAEEQAATMSLSEEDIAKIVKEISETPAYLCPKPVVAKSGTVHAAVCEEWAESMDIENTEPKLPVETYEKINGYIADLNALDRKPSPKKKSRKPKDPPAAVPENPWETKKAATGWGNTADVANALGRANTAFYNLAKWEDMTKPGAVAVNVKDGKMIDYYTPKKTYRAKKRSKVVPVPPPAPRIRPVKPNCTPKEILDLMNRDAKIVYDLTGEREVIDLTNIPDNTPSKVTMTDEGDVVVEIDGVKMSMNAIFGDGVLGHD